jgi:hypothetical protein
MLDIVTNGSPGRTRTDDTRINSPLLLPAELPRNVENPLYFNNLQCNKTIIF